MRLILCAVAVALAGCGIQMKLLDDGRMHEGHYSPGPGASMDVTVDGTLYKGPIMQNTAVGFGTGFVGTRSFQTTSIGIGTGGQSMMTSADGKWIACQFNAALGSGMGQCQDGAGKVYGLLIGTAATPIVPPDPKTCIIDSTGRCMR
jgi:hypothetical protein